MGRKLLQMNSPGRRKRGRPEKNKSIVREDESDDNIRHTSYSDR